MKEHLLSLGLTEREAEAYLALVQLEEAPATEIAKRTKEHRTNIYDSLEQLTKKGLVSYVMRKGTRYYQALTPDRLVDYIRQKEHLALKVSAELKQKHAAVQSKPSIEIYEGDEGFKSLLWRMLRSEETIYAIGASPEWARRYPAELEVYMREREKKKIKAHLLYPKNTVPIRSSVNEIRFLQSVSDATTSIAIFGNQVAVFIWTNPLVATLTTSQEFARSMKSYFDVLWKTSAI